MQSALLRRLFLALIAVTVVALAWNRLGMDAVTVIDANTRFSVSALDDRFPDGGHSVATVTRENRRLGLECDIRPGAERPFCALLVEFGRGMAGLDLRRYDVMRAWVSAAGPEPRQRVLIEIRSVEANAGVPADFDAQPLQSLALEPDGLPQGFDVPLARFGVPERWLERHPDGAAARALWFNVLSLAIVTPSNVLPGMHHVRIDRIELRGKLVSTDAMRLALLGMWMAFAIAWLVNDAIETRRARSLSPASQLSLQRLDESLRLETRSLAIARSDPLTGLLNRAGLADELVRLARIGGDAIFPLTLIFIDIDRFRRLNETWGNAVGDEVIRELVSVVRSAVQRDDLFARWGGEEFLLVFRDMRGPEARAIAERLRERIADHSWPNRLELTCSFGISEWHRGEDLSEGVRRADEAMYRAKKGGRNRVEVQLDAASDEAFRV